MTFILDFFKDMLYKLGIWRKEGKMVFLGLDNAGKSTLLVLLKTGKFTQLEPTHHSHSEDLLIGNVNISAFDLGGHTAMRKLWRDFYPVINAIVYIVDAADPSRFQESREEFEKITSDSVLGNIPILVLGNKIDKRGAVSEDELRLAMGLAQSMPYGLQKVDNINGKQVEVFMCCLAKKSGFTDGLNWLTKYI